MSRRGLGLEGLSAVLKTIEGLIMITQAFQGLSAILQAFEEFDVTYPRPIPMASLALRRFECPCQGAL